MSSSSGIVVEKGLIACDICPRRYANKSTFNRHRRTHDRGEWHTCRVCRLKFSRADVLRRHEQVHSDDGGAHRGRQRAIRACDTCRKSKIRCSGQTPCNACEKAGRVCTYQTVSVRASLAGFDDGDEQLSALPTDLETTPSWHGQSTGDSASERSSHGSSFDSPPAETGAAGDLGGMDGLGASPALTPPDLALENLPGLADQLDPGDDTPADEPSTGFGPEIPCFNLQGPDCVLFPSDQSLFAGLTGLTEGFGSFPAYAQPLGYNAYDFLDEFNEPWNASTDGPIQVDPSIVERQKPRVAERLACDASEEFLGGSAWDVASRCRRRVNASRDIEAAFELSNLTGSLSTHLLHAFVAAFFDHFHPLWPMTWRQGFDYDKAEPLLYLTMSSIGAMYVDSSGAKSYGITMHHALRPVLLQACLACPDDEDKADAICEALLLTEMMSLYLGHSQAAKYVHQAGAVLVAHARRTSLLSESPSQQLRAALNETNPTEDDLRQWIKMERRRRIAFGFLRCEIFSSILLKNRPLLSSEEFHLKLPCPDELWIYVGPGWRHKLLAAVQEEMSRPIFYSDLLRMATCNALADSPRLPAAAHELLLYGLQTVLWKWIYDRHDLSHDELSDLTGRRRLSSNASRVGDGRPHREALVDVAEGQPIHSTENLDTSPLSPVVEILERWKGWYDPVSRPTCQSKILYHMGHIRMNADLEAIHHLSSQSLSTLDAATSKQVQRIAWWVNTEEARVAVHHARQIRTLMEMGLRERERPRDEARIPAMRLAQTFNILSIMSLYHAAMVMWAVTAYSSGQFASYPRGSSNNGRLASNDDIHQDLRKIVQIASKLSPSWESASSFLAAIKSLPQKTFPTTSP